VSEEAVEELRKTIDNVALDIAKRAVLFADDAARFRVESEDVRCAMKEFLESGFDRRKLK